MSKNDHEENIYLKHYSKNKENIIIITLNKP